MPTHSDSTIGPMPVTESDESITDDEFSSTLRTFKLNRRTAIARANDTFVCSACGETKNVQNDRVLVDGFAICNDCDVRTFRCSICGSENILSENHHRVLSSGYIICHNCLYRKIYDVYHSPVRHKLRTRGIGNGIALYRCNGCGRIKTKKIMSLDQYFTIISSGSTLIHFNDVAEVIKFYMYTLFERGYGIYCTKCGCGSSSSDRHLFVLLVSDFSIETIVRDVIYILEQHLPPPLYPPSHQPPRPSAHRTLSTTITLGSSGGIGVVHASNTPKTGTYKPCYNCGRICDTSELKKDKRTDTEQYLCMRCSENIDSLFHNYTFKPTPIFYKTDGEPDDITYFGCEIETDITDECKINNDFLKEMLEKFSKYQKYFYFKPDASVTGIEIVTHPFSLNYWKLCFPLDDLLNYLYDNGHITYSTSCGFHVHMSLTAFRNNTHKVVFSTFLNMQKKRTAIISGRLSDKYAFYKECKINNARDCNKLIVPNHDTCIAHHEAINWANKNTVELRTFKGIETKQEALAYIEYADSVCEFTKNQSLTNVRKRLTMWNEYVKFITDNSKYMELNKYLDILRRRFKNINITI